MSVYTTVSSEALSSFLLAYNVGELVDFLGISAGMENTNYFVETSKGSFVLTLYEHHMLRSYLSSWSLCIIYQCIM